MSLINEALRRANRNSAGATPAGGPPMRATEPPSQPEGGVGFVLPVLLVIAVALGTALLWQGLRAESEMHVRARTRVDAPVEAKAEAAKPPQVAIQEKAQESVQTAGQPVATNVPAVRPMATHATNTQMAVAEQPKPLPITYKLQGIFFRPERPVAVINGKTVLVGDRVGDARVISIEPNAAAIVTASGQTNLLELP